MDINRVIAVVRNLKEGVPTNNTGSNGSTAGFSADATGAMTGYDKYYMNQYLIRIIKLLQDCLIDFQMYSLHINWGKLILMIW